MLSTSIAIAFSALTLTSACAAEGTDRVVATQPALVAAGGDMVKTSLMRPQAAAASEQRGAAAAAASANDAPQPSEAPREVSLEMVLAALALMLVITLRRFHSGPR